MKCVLLAVKPKYLKDIISGKKTIEFRKTHPRMLPAFKVYLYESEQRKKVVGECTCHGWWNIKDYDRDISVRTVKDGCLSKEEIKAYGNGAAVYGWQLRSVVEYEKPIDIDRFHLYDEELEFFMLKKQLKRPPQSWCYVEEYKGE